MMLSQHFLRNLVKHQHLRLKFQVIHLPLPTLKLLNHSNSNHRDQFPPTTNLHYSNSNSHQTCRIILIKNVLASPFNHRHLKTTNNICMSSLQYLKPRVPFLTRISKKTMLIQLIKHGLKLNQVHYKMIIQPRIQHRLKQNQLTPSHQPYELKR